ncbi:MAG TPA: fibronectin type III domain-containing protein [Roseiflexaceae bacterium]
MRNLPRNFWMLLIVICLAMVGIGAPRASHPAAAAPAPQRSASPTADCSAGPCVLFLPLVDVAPLAPILNDPLDQAQVDSIAPTLTWTPAITGTKYTIQIASSPDFVSGTVVLSATNILSAPTQALQHSVPRGNLKGVTAYYWRVGVYLPDGIHYSQTAQFTTAADDPARYPPPPPQLAPPNGAKVTTTTPTFVWAALPGADFYRVKIIDRLTGQTVRTSSAIDAPQTSYTPSDPLLLHNRTYQWQVRSHTSYAWSDYGPLWDVKIQ